MHFVPSTQTIDWTPIFYFVICLRHSLVIVKLDNLLDCDVDRFIRKYLRVEVIMPIRANNKQKIVSKSHFRSTYCKKHGAMWNFAFNFLPVERFFWNKVGANASWQRGSRNTIFFNDANSQRREFLFCAEWIVPVSATRQKQFERKSNFWAKLDLLVKFGIRCVRL